MSHSPRQATCRRSGLPVALKIYFLSRVPANVLHMIKREIQIHSQMVHKHVLRLYGAFIDGDERVVLVEEYASNGDLFNVQQRLGGRMLPQQVADAVLRPFLEAVSYLHSRGVIHRDIKPENVLFTQSWRLVLADFGVSINVSQERAVTRAGTEGYMAPEVERCPIKSEPSENKDQPQLAYSTAVDIWAVGVLAYELMVGIPPAIKPLGAKPCASTAVDGFAQAEMSAAGLHFPASVPPAARSFIAAALAPDPADRPTAAQLLSHPWLAAEAVAQRQDAAAEAHQDAAGEVVMTAAAQVRKASSTVEAAAAAARVRRASSTVEAVAAARVRRASSTVEAATMPEPAQDDAAAEALAAEQGRARRAAESGEPAPLPAPPARQNAAHSAVIPATAAAAPGSRGGSGTLKLQTALSIT
ncbi:hypothetical protein GPECTOR_9g643 [Gonium pectorale]|uniref:Protein kinase domain-containing protein n=1 Tax=Gonium pectorale TaxID=33097 RepID=A0A150GSD5_GONPE|nr:hypothetical protein GPECTOR_9g643 [Gonium pectorale]|eukprot:KXZ52598.1 hypothetical protein GPECTOR_9g643 [Gonium pectorale]